MRDRILRAILHEDLSVTWEGSDRLNMHQAARQFVEVKLDGFLLLNEEVIRVAFEYTKSPEEYHLNPILMKKVIGETGLYRVRVPLLVRQTSGEWELQFFICTGYNPESGDVIDSYPSDKQKFIEFSSIEDDGISIPSNEDVANLYAAVLENATGAAKSAEQAEAYMQALATNQPNNSEAGFVGEPTVSIEQADDGRFRFKFSNLKGEKGEQGEQGIQGEKGEQGEKGDKGDTGIIEIVRLI